MARNLSPKTKRARRLGLALTDKQIRILGKRNFPPGQHGPVAGYPRLSEYGKQLREKQKAKFVYGLMEKQFKNYVAKASKKQGDTGLTLYVMLESRLDNVVYRAGLANTRPHARQLVSHAHFKVNGKKVNIPSFQLKVGDVVEVRDRSLKSPVFAKIKEALKTREQQISWLTTNPETLAVKVVDLPKAQDMSGEFDTKLIVEYYSK